MATNRAKVAARERARQRRLVLDAERARRDGQIEQAAAQYFEAQDSFRAAAVRMSEAVATLTSLGESTQRIQFLLEISSADRRRVRDVVGAAAVSGSVTGTGSGAIANGAAIPRDRRSPDRRTTDYE